MNCTKCNAPINEGELYCKACGNQFAVNEQKAKVNQAFENTKNIVVKQTSSPIFLVVAILFTILTLTSVTNILAFIFAVIATVGLWMAFASKDNNKVAKSLRMASIYDAYTRVMYTISIVLLSIFAAISFIGAIVVAVAGSELFGGDDFLIVGIVLAVVVLIVFAIAITITALFKGVYAKRRAYFKAIAKTAEDGKYVVAKAPVVGSYIIGGANVLSAISTFAFSLSAMAIIENLDDLIDELGEVGDFFVDAIGSLIGITAFSGAAILACGAYMILSAVWMSMVHKAEMANRNDVMAECARLEELEAATKEAVFAAEVQKKAADEAEADKKAQEQQQMMQMMMQMMAANGGVMPHMAAPAEEAAPVEEAPAEEVAPVEEAPAEEVAPETAE